MFALVKMLMVSLDFGDCEPILVGRLALNDRQVYFQFESKFLSQGLDISPFHLPLIPGLQQFNQAGFSGLPGVIDDSLPDGWGRLLLDRKLREEGIVSAQLSSLDRLAHVGKTGLGALIYAPCENIMAQNGALNLDQMAVDSQRVLEGESGDILETLCALAGASAGARPKALIGLDASHQNIIHGLGELPDNYSHWLVKFPNIQDGPDAGAVEYVYAKMAVEAGLKMPEVHLFESNHGPGFFATKRFDRDGHKRTHLHSVAGLLHADFRTPSLDYKDLLLLTERLTKDHREVEKMFRIAVFNLIGHNRDDHGKNFSFLMDSKGGWTLAPAYDLTFSSGPGGEHSTMYLGQGANPGVDELMALAKDAGIAVQQAKAIIEQMREAFSHWPKLAREYGVFAENIELINLSQQLP